MLDVLYWTARLALVGAWLGVAFACWRRDAGRGPIWRACALLALGFASVRLLLWNYLFLERGQALLRTLAVYHQRFWVKAVLALALAAALVVVLRRLWSARAHSLTWLGCALAAQGALLAVETLSLDDPLPRWLFTQPWRYLIEAALAVIALRAALGRKDRTCSPPPPTTRAGS